MNKMVRCSISLLFLCGFTVLLSTQTMAATKSEFVTNLLSEWEKSAKAENSKFNGFKVEEGKALFFAKRMHSDKNELRSCTSCHSTNLAIMGQTPVGKSIDPLSPAVTTDRFQDLEKIEKWFGRNCKWVFERKCTSEEKGHYFTYFFSL